VQLFDAPNSPFNNYIDLVPTSESRSIVVSGKAETIIPATSAAICFTISSESASADDAWRDMQQKEHAIMEEFANSFSIPSSQFTMQEQMETKMNEEGSLLYIAHAMVTVCGVGVAQLPKAIDAGIHAGADAVEKIEYISMNFNETYHRMLGLAMDRARAKAIAIARADMERVGNVQTVSEQVQIATSNADGIPVAAEIVAVFALA